MPENDCVHAANSRQVARDVLAQAAFRRYGRIAVQARVGDHDDNVSFEFRAQVVHSLRGCSSDVYEGITLVVLRLLPTWYGRRCDADNAYLHPIYLFEEERLERFAAAAWVGVGICGEPREIGFVSRLVEVLEAEVELMVAERHGIEA